MMQWICSLTAVCTGSLLLLACQPPGDLLDYANGPHAPTPAQLRGVLFEGYAAGAREVEVRAARANLHPAERVVHLERVQIRFQDERRGQIHIDAERAELRLDSDDFMLHGRVEGSTTEGERFSTAEVRYEQASGRLWTDQPVRLYRSIGFSIRRSVDVVASQLAPRP